MREENTVDALMRAVSLRHVLLEQLPALVAAMIIAEVFHQVP
jgi:hypothetical protein